MALGLQGILAGLKALWKGSGGGSGNSHSNSVSHAAAKARAAAGADGAAFKAPLRRSGSYGEGLQRLQQLQRTSSGAHHPAFKSASLRWR